MRFCAQTYHAVAAHLPLRVEVVWWRQGLELTRRYESTYPTCQKRVCDHAYKVNCKIQAHLYVGVKRVQAAVLLHSQLLFQPELVKHRAADT